MIIVVFRSRLSNDAGADYQAMETELGELVQQNPGFIDAKSYVAPDGEHLTIVWWRDEESLRAWRELPRHREAQQSARLRWHEFYHVEVATVTRSSAFDRTRPPVH
ncbi:MAG TPA: antibiotic biosynthesis monooxygenase [Gemmatimonadaceae bacterium]